MFLVKYTCLMQSLSNNRLRRRSESPIHEIKHVSPRPRPCPPISTVGKEGTREAIQLIMAMLGCRFESST